MGKSFAIERNIVVECTAIQLVLILNCNFALIIIMIFYIGFLTVFFPVNTKFLTTFICFVTTQIVCICCFPHCSRSHTFTTMFLFSYLAGCDCLYNLDFTSSRFIVCMPSIVCLCAFDILMKIVTVWHTSVEYNNLRNHAHIEHIAVVFV